MPITLYKNGKTTTKQSQSGADYAVRNYGWSLTPPSASKTTAPKVETKPLVGQTPPVEIGKQLAKKVETPTAPRAVSVATPQANYSGLENRDGTIYLGDKAFKDPAELATHLGIQPHEINWGNIPQGQAPTAPTAEPPAVAPTLPAPTPKTTRSLIDIANSRPIVLETAKAQGGDPFTKGTKANTWLNNWWNTAGKNEFPDVILGEPIDEQTQITNEANQVMEEFFDNLPDGDDLDVSDSQKILDEIIARLESGEGMPEKPPSMAELFAETKASLGMEELETELAGIDNEIDAINAELLIQGGEAEEGLVSMREIGREKGALQKKADDRILRLQVQRSAVARMLNNKISSLNMIMQFTQQDYQNSAAYYKANFDRSIQMYNLISGAEEKEQEIEDRARDEAKANLTVISTIMQESGNGYDGLSEDQILQINSLETQAGLPVGLFQFTLEKDPEFEIQTVTSRTDNAGNTYFDVLKVGPDGEMIVDSIYKGKGKISTSGSGGTGGGFTSQEKRKLEQAGLLYADRERQLDFLYGEEEDIYPEEVPPWFEKQMSEIMQMSKDWTEEWESYKEEKGVGKTTEVEDQFSNTQISKGANNAGMSISEFKELSVDEANKWISRVY